MTSTDNRTRGHDLKLIKQTCSEDATKYYFTNREVNVWNSLLSHIVSSSTLSTFKSRLEKTWFFVLFDWVCCLVCGFYISCVSFSSFYFFSYNLYCFVVISVYRMLCYCYGSVSDHFGPSALINLDLDLDCRLAHPPRGRLNSEVKFQHCYSAVSRHRFG